MSEDDKLKRVYVQLVSLRKNLPKTHPNSKMEWHTVNLYNELLSKLEALGFDTGDFKLPQEMLSNEIVQVNYLTNEREATGRSNVTYGAFNTRIDALLGYFEISGEKTQIGFHP